MEVLYKQLPPQEDAEAEAPADSKEGEDAVSLRRMLERLTGDPESC